MVFDSQSILLIAYIFSSSLILLIQYSSDFFHSSLLSWNFRFYISVIDVIFYFSFLLQIHPQITSDLVLDQIWGVFLLTLNWWLLVIFQQFYRFNFFADVFFTVFQIPFSIFKFVITNLLYVRTCLHLSVVSYILMYWFLVFRWNEVLFEIGKNIFFL